jgi:hypothetical protein
MQRLLQAIRAGDAQRRFTSEGFRLVDASKEPS